MANSAIEWNRGEILFINIRARTASVLDEVTESIVETILPYHAKDEDLDLATTEFIYKEGNKVKLVYHLGEPEILGPAPTLVENMDVNKLKIQKKITNVNEGDSNKNGLVTDGTSIIDGYGKTNSSLFGILILNFC